MRKIVSVLSAAVLTLTLCACSSGSSTTSITVAGSTTCLPIAEIADGTPFDRRSAVLSGTGQVRDVVSRSRGAIGYISLGFVDSLNAKTSVKAVSVNHVEASEKTVASGGYPISRDLYFFVKGAPSQQAQDYIDYVTSEKMDKQIREAGFIPVTNDEKGSE